VNETARRARDLLRRFPLIDGHNDLPWELRERGDVDLAEPVAGTHTDLPRLAAGGVGAQFWSVFVPARLAGDNAVAAVLEQIDLARRMIAAYPRALEFALTAADVERIFASGRVASLLGAEGGHSIAGSLGVLRMLYALGVRYMTLTHNANVGWADSATDQRAAGGLTDFGRDVVREMQRLGMLVDLSHVSPDTMHAALDTAAAPVIFSHSSARAICDNPRNVPDEVLARLPGNGGVCMVTFVPGFVSQECSDWLAGLKAEAARRGLDPKDFAQLWSIKPGWEAAHPRPRATLAQVADHIEHVRRVAGLEHVGLGGDFDGTSDVTVGLEDVSTYPALFAELLTRGWTEPDCAALAGGNLLRVLRAAESVAEASQAESTVDAPAAQTPLPGARRLSGGPPRPPAPPEPLSSHPMTADAQPLPAATPAPTRLRSAGALSLLTWPALDASGVDAAVTARSGGVSSGPYATLNLGLTVGDDPALVLENRRRLAAAIGARPADFVFARQVHGTEVRIVGDADRGSGAFTADDAVPDTDALVTANPGVVLAILAADCVPIVLHDPVAGVLACVHAGWRGTVARVSAAAVAAMTSLGSRPSDVIAGLGPTADPAGYQVGPDVHQAVTQAFGPAAPGLLRPDPATPGRWFLDLWSANLHVLRDAGLPDRQIHVTTLPTGPLAPSGHSTSATPADRTTPEPPAGHPSPGTPASLGYVDPTRHGYFFSHRAASPCGRLALVARLRPPKPPAGNQWK
jgi:membrane dipeptidase